MSDPWNAPLAVAHRLLAGLFGVPLGLSNFLCALGLLAMFTLLEDSGGGHATFFLVVGLLVLMVFVLAGAASALLVFAFTGRRGPIIHRGSLKVLVVVAGTVLSVAFVGNLLAQDWTTALRLVGVGTELAGIYFFAGSASGTPRGSRDECW